MIDQRVVNYYVKLAWLIEVHEKRLRLRNRHEYESTLKVYQLFKGDPVHITVQPLAYYAEEVGFIMAEINGIRLDKVLLRAMNPLSSQTKPGLFQAMTEAGRWLAEFQKKLLVDSEKKYSQTDLESRLDDVLANISKKDQKIIGSQSIDQLKTLARRTLDNFTSEDFLGAAKHNDFAPWNLNLTSEGIAVFDFADMGVDLNFYDACYFLRATNSFKSKVIKSDQVIEQCAYSFMQGFGRSLSQEHPVKIYFDILFSVQNIVSLDRARQRSKGFVGQLKGISNRVHARRCLKEIKLLLKS